MQCKFCEIIRTSKQVVYRDDEVVALLDHDPISTGHLLVCPVEHYLDLDEIPEPLLGKLFKLAGACVRSLKSHFEPAGYSIMQNGGLFNEVGHFHLHIFPRYEESTFQWNYINAVPQAAFAFEELKTALTPILDQLMKPGFPTLETERLILNQLKATDIHSIVTYAGNEKVSKMTLNIPYPYTDLDAVYWINASREGARKKEQYTFAVRLKESKYFIGGMGLKLTPKWQRAELGYWIAEPYWNQGFATEAAAAVLRFGFETLCLNKIYATHLVENPASGRVMIKNGMIR
ncbi:MAG: GNAT family N-acetyltransferase, partial [Sinomicrobium sp.]|nr:GNAT family N-acetyltransferase [Sinomicrobium sp.]